MKELSIVEVSEVNGGFDLFSIGAAVAACVIGFLTGGPVGLGTALCGVAMTAGVNRAVGVTVEAFNTNPNEQKPK